MLWLFLSHMLLLILEIKYCSYLALKMASSNVVAVFFITYVTINFRDKILFMSCSFIGFFKCCGFFTTYVTIQSGIRYHVASSNVVDKVLAMLLWKQKCIWLDDIIMMVIEVTKPHSQWPFLKLLFLPLFVKSWIHYTTTFS